MKLDSRHWKTGDGHRYVSVPAPVPSKWTQKHDDLGLFYASGPYTIHRHHDPRNGRTFTVYRDGVRLGLGVHARLRDAKAHAVANARGREVVNVA